MTVQDVELKWTRSILATSRSASATIWDRQGIARFRYLRSISASNVGLLIRGDYQAMNSTGPADLSIELIVGRDRSITYAENHRTEGIAYAATMNDRELIFGSTKIPLARLSAVSASLPFVLLGEMDQLLAGRTIDIDFIDVETRSILTRQFAPFHTSADEIAVRYLDRDGELSELNFDSKRMLLNRWLGVMRPRLATANGFCSFRGEMRFVY